MQQWAYRGYVEYVAFVGSALLMVTTPYVGQASTKDLCKWQGKDKAPPPEVLVKVLASYKAWFEENENKLRGERHEVKDPGYSDERRMNLCGVDLHGANLQEALRAWANLQGADLRWASLQKTNLLRANLQRAHLYEANLQRANLTQAEKLLENSLGQSFQ